MRKPKEALTGEEILHLYPSHHLFMSPCRVDQRSGAIMWGVVRLAYNFDDVDSFFKAIHTVETNRQGFTIRCTKTPDPKRVMII